MDEAVPDSGEVTAAVFGWRAATSTACQAYNERDLRSLGKGVFQWLAEVSARWTLRAVAVAFTECTAVRAPIGYLDPKLESPNGWNAVPVKM